MSIYNISIRDQYSTGEKDYGLYHCLDGGVWNWYCTQDGLEGGIMIPDSEMIDMLMEDIKTLQNLSTVGAKMREDMRNRLHKALKKILLMEQPKHKPHQLE